MNRNKLHRVVEWIRSQTDFPFDAADVEENVTAVVAHFGFTKDFTPEELDVLRNELVPLGLATEFGEVARLLDQSAEGLLLDLAAPSRADELLARARARKAEGQLAAFCERMLHPGAV